jgi:hypothetical protein
MSASQRRKMIWGFRHRAVSGEIEGMVAEDRGYDDVHGKDNTHAA